MAILAILAIFDQIDHFWGFLGILAILAILAIFDDFAEIIKNHQKPIFRHSIANATVPLNIDKITTPKIAKIVIWALGGLGANWAN